MLNQKNYTDFYLWKCFKDGDKQALDIVFKRHYSALYTYGIKLTNNVNLTEDGLQDFFLYLYEHRQNLKDLDAIKPYLFKAFRNRLLKYLKTNTAILPLDDVKEHQLPIHFTIEEIIVQKEDNLANKAKVLTILQALTNRQRELIYLKYYNHLSIQEIAEVVGISYQGVLNGLSKAMKKLRKVLVFVLISMLCHFF